MKKYLLGVFLLLAIVVTPAPVKAATVEELQAMIAQLRAQIAAMQNCVSFNQDLSLGDGEQGDGLAPEVKRLQNFLISKGYLARNLATGYFGKITKSALIKFQQANDPAHSGAFAGITQVTGDLDGSTQARIKELTCGSVVACPFFALPPPGWCPAPSKIVSGGQNAQGCWLPQKCVSSPVGVDPVLKGISGPVSLSIRQTGTWKIDVTAPTDALLQYNVDWGDDKITMPLSSGYSASTAVKNTGTFTHAYSLGGKYTVTFTVINNAKGGGTPVKTSMNVTVGSSVGNGVPRISKISAISAKVVYSASSPTHTGLKISVSGDIVANNGHVYVPETGISFFARGNDGRNKIPDGVLEKTVSIQTSVTTGIYGSKLYFLPEGETKPFNISLTYDVNQMLAGSYYAELGSILYGSGLDTSNYQRVDVGPYRSSSIYVVGEKGPYIREAITASDENKLYLYKLAGINLTNVSDVIVDGKYFRESFRPGSEEESYVYFGTTPLSVGSHKVSVIDYAGLKSNTVVLNVGEKGPYINSVKYDGLVQFGFIANVHVYGDRICNVGQYGQLIDQPKVYINNQLAQLAVLPCSGDGKYIHIVLGEVNNPYPAGSYPVYVVDSSGLRSNTVVLKVSD